MKNLTFHLPKNYEKIRIESEEAEDYLNTEKSAEELKNILIENLPWDMYSKLVENVVVDYLMKNCDVKTLVKFKDVVDSSNASYIKGIDLYQILKKIL
ncbi:hypothetical protein M0R72_04985 [Candidatus Pacearchaeota archaeon]|jgi:hypothetical protein|nr:hypothetical protein [Candidatus Pacearchaeota archaeon]